MKSRNHTPLSQTAGRIILMGYFRFATCCRPSAQSGRGSLGPAYQVKIPHLQFCSLVYEDDFRGRLPSDRLKGCERIAPPSESDSEDDTCIRRAEEPRTPSAFFVSLSDSDDESIAIPRLKFGRIPRVDPSQQQRHTIRSAYRLGPQSDAFNTSPRSATEFL